MGDAFNTIRHGFADLILSGGSEAALTPLGLAAFAAMKALSTRNDDPAAASRPWDRERDGFVLSDGAGCVALEDYGHASLIVLWGCNPQASGIHLVPILKEARRRGAQLAVQEAEVLLEGWMARRVLAGSDPTR